MISKSNIKINLVFLKFQDLTLKSIHFVTINYFLNIFKKKYEVRFNIKKFHKK